VLNRVLDDPTFATINSLIFFNNVEIVTQLQNDSKLIGEMYVRGKARKERERRERGERKKRERREKREERGKEERERESRRGGEERRGEGR
jgi:Component of IIS longevity pathway SMK-1